MAVTRLWLHIQITVHATRGLLARGQLPVEKLKRSSVTVSVSWGSTHDPFLASFHSFKVRRSGSPPRISLNNLDCLSVNSILWRHKIRARRKNPLLFYSLSALYTVSTLPNLPPVEDSVAFEGLIACLSRMQFCCDRKCYPNIIIIIIIIQHLFMRHISSHCGHSEAHYKQTYT